MPDAIPRSAFAARYDLPDWRVLAESLETWWVAPSFSEAASFAGEVAQAADAADHHPDLDLRYPGRVHVLLTSHDAHGLTARDAALARTISERAAARGLTAEPGASTRLELAIDALDIDVVRPFWAAVLGYEDEAPDRDGVVRALRDPAGISPAVWFQQMDAPRPQRSRIHVDVLVPHDEADARRADAMAAGGTLLSEAEAPAFWVLADAEGNEACICTWQGRE